MPCGVWACLRSFMWYVGNMNSPGKSVVVEGAIVSTAPLIVVFIHGGRAHVKDGVQTASRHNLIFA